MKRIALQCHSHCQRRRERSESNDVRQALLASGIFRKSDPDSVSVWSKGLKSVQFQRGRVVGSRGDFAGCLYVIVSGKVKVSFRRADGREMVLRILGASEIFG